jgi:surface antigen
MRGVILGVLAALALPLAPAMADAIVASSDDAGNVSGGGGSALPPYLQCVPYARQVSGIEIYGDARTWWNQAEGRYKRGETPRVGAVMAFKPHGNMVLGHVAAVSKIIDSRTVLLRHANWSLIGGRRGQIENAVQAVDVSPDNDWSEVRVWYAPIHGLGTTHWPVEGFIYPKKTRNTKIPLDALPGSNASDPIGDIIAERLKI